MSDAQRLFDEMKVEMLPLEDRIRSHPFLSAVESGSVPRERFRLLAGEQYHIIESDLRMDGSAVTIIPGSLNSSLQAKSSYFNRNMPLEVQGV